jgi:hypothetical protein
MAPGQRSTGGDIRHAFVEGLLKEIAKAPDLGRLPVADFFDSFGVDNSGGHPLTDSRGILR